MAKMTKQQLSDKVAEITKHDSDGIEVTPDQLDKFKNVMTGRNYRIEDLSDVVDYDDKYDCYLNIRLIEKINTVMIIGILYREYKKVRYEYMMHVSEVIKVMTILKPIETPSSMIFKRLNLPAEYAEVLDSIFIADALTN